LKQLYFLAQLSRSTYHPMTSRTIRFRRKSRRLAVAVFTVLLAGPSANAAAGASQVSDALAGFAGVDANLFSPVIELASPGASRAARASAAFDRELAFQSRLSFHPELSPELKELLNVLPPRQSTLIRASALYARDDIGWIDSSSVVRMIAVAGEPRSDDYYYRLAPAYSRPDSVEHFAGVFALAPAIAQPQSRPSSVIARLGGEFMMDTFGGGELVDAVARLISECRGDLEPPWNSAPGIFDHHDKAALARIHRDLPRFAAKIDETIEFHNLLDEFDSPDGAYVLANVDAVIRPGALKKYPLFERFWNQVSAVVETNAAILDPRGHYWLRSGIDHGHIKLMFMVRHGMLTPFDDRFLPAGPSIALNELSTGGYRTVSNVHLRTLGMNFGLEGMDFATTYTRSEDAITLESRMQSVPRFVAPVGIHQIIDLIANDFITVLATGNGGLRSSVDIRAIADGRWRYASEFAAEFHYAPTLEFLARIGDALADAHNDRVRAQERAFASELFDALAADYNDARPKLIAQDSAAGKK
jgi:hypothetical protein